MKSVEYFSFRIDDQGIHKTSQKVDAIRNAKRPDNVKEVQAFLGLVTFYGRFVPNLSTIAHPLYYLLRQDVEWNWSDQCQQALDRIKEEITSTTFLTHFKPNLPVVCDASSVGIGAVLAHVMSNGNERPIAYSSRSLKSC